MASGGLLEFARIFMQRVAKPLSSAIGNYAKTHPRLRRRCIMTGHSINYYYVRFTHYNALRNGDAGTKMTIKALGDDRAAALGSEIIAESILTMIPITFVIITLNHKRKEDKQLRTMQNNIETITGQYETVSTLLNEMQIELVRLQGMVENRLHSESEIEEESDCEEMNQYETVAAESTDSQIESSILAELDGQQSVSVDMLKSRGVWKSKETEIEATDLMDETALNTAVSAVPLTLS